MRRGRCEHALVRACLVSLLSGLPAACDTEGSGRAADAAANDTTGTDGGGEPLSDAVGAPPDALTDLHEADDDVAAYADAGAATDVRDATSGTDVADAREGEDVAPATGDAGSVGDDGPEVDGGPAEEDAHTFRGCGDGILDADEQCDGDAFLQPSCASLGFAGGALACGADCRYDVSGCAQPPACADDDAEENDEHDDAVPLSASRRYDFTLCDDPGEEDWFALPMRGTTNVATGIAFDPAQGSLRAEVWAHPEPGELIWRFAVADEVAPGHLSLGPLPALPLDTPIYLRVYETAASAALAYEVQFVPDAECVTSSQCGPGAYCDLGATFACLPGCRTDGDCEPGATCNAGTCVPGECLVHADCARGEACVAGYKCRDAACTSDDQCAVFPPAAGGLVCDTANGRCVGCRTVEDCGFPEGYACVDSRCAVRDCTDDRFAPNAHRDIATPLTLVDGLFDEPALSLCGAYAEDWYRIRTTAPGPLRIEAFFAQSEGDIDLYLYRAGDESPYHHSESQNDDEEISVREIPADTWYVLVRSYESGAPTRFAQDYGLRISTRATD